MAIGRRRLFGILLTVSLALNLFAIGIFIGVVATGGGQWANRGGNPWGGGFQASPAFMALEPESRQLAIERFQEDEKKLRGQTRALRRAQRDVVRTMTADPFDPNAASNALQELRQQTDAIQATIHNYLVDLSRSLTAEERERLGRSIFRGPAHRTPLASHSLVVLIPAG
jgi:uncharacterized membrane protein